MKLIFESSLMTPSISETFSILTSAAKICVDDIHYDKKEGIVEIPMKRKELIGFKKIFLLGTQPVYSKTKIDALLTIRDVVDLDMQVDNLLITECHSCFTVLLGLHVKGNELYLGSVEEDRGKTLCHIFIKVKRINIECVDMENPR